MTTTSPECSIDITHGWRMYHVDGNRLLSPFVAGNFEMPRDGVLEDVYFVPEARYIWRLQFAPNFKEMTPIASTRALTFGEVKGPFERDHVWQNLCSIKCARYHTLCIIHENPNNLSAYNLPIIEDDGWLSSLQAIQQQIVHGRWPVLPNYQLHVTFICKYNKARSPIAANVFAQQLRERGLGDAVRVTSAGTSSSWQGGDMDERAAVQLRQHGYDCEHEVTRLSKQNLNADIVIAMDHFNAQRLLDLGVPRKRLRFLRSFDPSASFDTCDVLRPYHDEDFARTFQVIAAALPRLQQWVGQQLQLVSSHD